MKKIKKVVFLIILFSCIHMWTQEVIKAILIDSLEVKTDNYIEKNNLKKNYFSFKNVIKKRNSSQEYEYQNLSLWKIKGICINNPLQIVVFYEDFNFSILEWSFFLFSDEAKLFIVPIKKGMMDYSYITLFGVIQLKVFNRHYKELYVTLFKNVRPFSAVL